MSPENSAMSDVESLSTKEALNKLKTAIKDELEREQVNFYLLWYKYFKICFMLSSVKRFFFFSNFASV